MTADTLTIVRAARRRLTKLWRIGGGSEGFNSARLFDFYEQPVADLDALEVVLSRLQHRVDCAVVRGAVADPARTRSVRRMVRHDPETGDRPTLLEKARPYVNLDMDGAPMPAGVDRTDLETCARAVLLLLPVELRQADCIVQATSSHLLKPGARLRLWFWLDRPVTGLKLQHWFRGSPVDPSTFRAAQIVYVANPVFEPGLSDPLPRRLLLLRGEARAVAVPSPAVLSPPPRAVVAVPLPTDKNGSRYAQAALNRACTAIANAPVDERHPTAVSESWGLARLVNAGLLREGEVVRAVEGALVQAGKPAGEGAAIAAWAVGQRKDAGNAPAGRG